jgi:pimeloyl-ACP methyl ester carboxylesterase
MKRRVCIAIAALVAASLLPAPAPATPLWQTDGLGAPYDGWNVTVAPVEGEPSLLALEFDSPALGFRARSWVVLPSVYDAETPVPAVYYLHGTRNFNGVILSPTPDQLWDDLGLGELGLGQPFEDEGSIGNEGKGYQSTLDRQRFMIVIPDAGERGWCAYCTWLDGTAVMAETHVLHELAPLVERVFTTRTDRGGRGVMGYSMGAIAATIYAARHPDLFAAAASFSGALDLFAEPFGYGEWYGYFRHQGYRHYLDDEIRWRNINPMDLAPNLVGAGVELLLLVSNGCLTTPTDPDCEGRIAPSDASIRSALIELALRDNTDRSAPRLTEAGVPFTLVRREGTHGQNNGDTYRNHFMPRMNAVFAADVTTPPRVSYKSADRAFSAWGYDVTVQRPNTEFLHLLGARTDGRDVILAGTGTVALKTPASFTPGAGYTVVLTPAGGTATELATTASASGRIAVDVTLGQARDMDERKALVDAGQFPFPQTRVEVLNR